MTGQKQDETWVAVTSKVGVEYQQHDNLLLCTSVSQGFRSGGFNGRILVPGLRLNKEEVVFAKLKQQARHAIEEHAADVLMLASTTMHQSWDYLREALPVSVSNPGLIAYKFCEVFLEFRLTHSKTTWPIPEHLQDAALFPG